MGDLRYKEIARATIGANRETVVSRRRDGKISIAQFEEVTYQDGNTASVFLKGAVVVDNEEFIAHVTLLNEAMQQIIVQGV